MVDGEVLIWQDGDAPAPFADLQKRIGRKTLSSKLLAELPAVLLAYDLLELDGVDLRALPQHERRALLETLVTGAGQAAAAHLAAGHGRQLGRRWRTCAPSRARAASKA